VDSCCCDEYQNSKAAVQSDKGAGWRCGQGKRRLLGGCCRPGFEPDRGSAGQAGKYVSGVWPSEGCPAGGTGGVSRPGARGAGGLGTGTADAEPTAELGGTPPDSDGEVVAPVQRVRAWEQRGGRGRAGGADRGWFVGRDRRKGQGKVRGKATAGVKTRQYLGCAGGQGGANGISHRQPGYGRERAGANEPRSAPGSGSPGGLDDGERPCSWGALTWCSAPKGSWAIGRLPARTPRNTVRFRLRGQRCYGRCTQCASSSRAERPGYVLAGPSEFRPSNPWPRGNTADHRGERS